MNTAERDTRIELEEQVVIPSFRDQLKSLINLNSIENYSDTPDYILADYLHECLQAFDKAVLKRRDWHSRENTKDWPISHTEAGK